MEPLEFERWVMNEFRRAGFDAHPTPASNDGGADAIVRDPKTGRRAIIQCKHSQAMKIGPAIVQDLMRAQLAYADPNAILIGVSNQVFANSTLRVAAGKNLILVDRHGIGRISKMVEAAFSLQAH